MGFKMSFNREELSGKPPVPPGWYTLQFKQFRPKIAGANKDGYMLNAECAVIGNQEYEGRKVFVGLSNKAGWVINAFVHACGVPLEVVQDGNAGTEAEETCLPGTFEFVDKFPDDPSQWGKYVGPLTNKTFEAELTTTSYQGRDKNEVRQFRCNLPNCNEKHPTNLISSKE
jgi:hypothetical protein